MREIADSRFSSARRGVLKAASGLAGVMAAGSAFAEKPPEPGSVPLPRLHAASEADDPSPPAPDRSHQRIGYAVVGLGDLAIKQILPAFGRSRHARVTALVSGHADKARTLARQYDVDERAVFGYEHFERLADRKDVDAVYIVLPNSLHAEFTLRAAAIGKHVLCEKPMATSVADCERMIAACATAKRLLMIGYRSQYEPHNRALVKLVREGRLGALKSFISSNSQNMGPPEQWRLKKALAGGGPLPDVGIYCINQIRFVSGEEPIEVSGTIIQKPDDPRFAEVEETAQFSLRFASGLVASCVSSYNAHKSQFMRLEGTEGWAALDPAYAYHGQKLRWHRLLDGSETALEPAIAETDQFALELDHFAECIREGHVPHTPGEEGLQDQRILKTIYAAAAAARSMPLSVPASATRGSDLPST